MAVAMSSLRTNIAKIVSPKYKTGTPSAVGAGSLTHAAILGLYGTDYFVGHYLLDSAGVAFYITASTTAGVLTMRPTATTPGAGVYEIMGVHPATVLDAINRMSARGFPLLNRWYVTENLVTDSPIPDPGFEDWTSSSALRLWQADTATLSRQSTSLFGGWNARLGTAAGFLQLKAAPRLTMLALRGYTVDVHAWVKCAVASTARINLRYLSIAGSATTNRSSFHTGGGGWERLTVSGVAIPATAQEVDLRLETDTANNADFDDVWLEGNGQRVWRYQVSDLLQEGPTAVYIAHIQDRDFVRNFKWYRWPFVTSRAREDEPGGNNLYEIEFNKLPPPQCRIRMEGPAVLQTLSASTDELLITTKEQSILEIRAAIDVLDGMATGTAATSNTSIRDVQAALRLQLPVLERDLKAPLRGGSLNFDT